MSHRALGSLLLLAVASPQLHADVIHVGPGPGAQFAEIQDAVVAAQPNDVLLVQPGMYLPVSVDKPLRILGDNGGGRVQILGGATAALDIQDIGLAEELVVFGVEPSTQQPDGFAIDIENCAGTVVLHDIKTDGAGTITFSHVRAIDCERVLVLESELIGGGFLIEVIAPPCCNQVHAGSIDAERSTIWLVNSEVTGRQTESIFPVDGAPGVRLVESTLYAWRSTVAGGAGNLAPDAVASAEGGAGIDASESSMFLYGGPLGEVLGGDGGFSFIAGVAWQAGPGIRLSNSELTLQADLTVVGGEPLGGGPPAVPVEPPGAPVTEEARVFPTLAVDAPETFVGGTFQVALEGTPGATQVLGLSFATGPSLILPGVAGIGIVDTGALFQIGQFALDGLGQASTTLAVPPNPLLLGRTLFLQSLEASPSGPALSSPLLVCIIG